MAARAQFLILAGVLILVSLPRKAKISTDDSTLKGNHATRVDEAHKISYPFTPANLSLYDQMDIVLFSSLQLDISSSV